MVRIDSRGLKAAKRMGDEKTSSAAKVRIDKSDTFFKTSQSKVAKWRMCRFAYHMRYVTKIRRKVKARPLKFGSIVHNMVEADIDGKNPFKVLSDIATREKNLFDREREMYGNIVTDIKYIMTTYFEYWDKQPKDKQIEYIELNGKHSEHPFEIQLDDQILAKGKIDAAAKARRLKWLVEHKTHKNFPDPDQRWRNVQSVWYIRVWDMMGWGQLDGTIWDYIRSKPPTRPEILKSGKLSKAALDSLPQVVEDVIKQNKLNRADYLDVIKAQQEKLPTWFQRVFTPVSKDIIQPIYDDMLSTSREMADKSLTSKERTIGRHCTWCDYRFICAAELQGHDVDYVMEKEYEKSEGDYDEVADQASESD